MLERKERKPPQQKINVCQLHNKGLHGLRLCVCVCVCGAARLLDFMVRIPQGRLSVVRVCHTLLVEVSATS